MRGKTAIKRGLGACCGACLLSGSSMIAVLQQWAFVWRRWLHLRAAAVSVGRGPVGRSYRRPRGAMKAEGVSGQRFVGHRRPAGVTFPCAGGRAVANLSLWIYHPEHLVQRLIATTPILLAFPSPLLSIPVIFALRTGCFTSDFPSADGEDSRERAPRALNQVDYGMGERHVLGGLACLCRPVLCR